MMPAYTLNTGITKANAYAIKVRKTFFAQLKDHVKKGELDNSEILRASAEINSFIFKVLQKLGIDKNDAIRIILAYRIEDGKIIYDLATLRLEVWKKLPENLVDEAMKAILSELQAQS